MRAAVTFFLFLCFYLLSSHSSADATCGNCNTGVTAHSIAKTQRVGTANDKHGYLVIKDDNLPKENDYLVGAQDEDEDIIRKNIVSHRFLLSSFYAFISSYLCKSQADHLSFYKSPYYIGSCKYVAQRALRI